MKEFLYFLEVEYFLYTAKSALVKTNMFFKISY